MPTLIKPRQFRAFLIVATYNKGKLVYSSTRKMSAALSIGLLLFKSLICAKNLSLFLKMDT